MLYWTYEKGVATAWYFAWTREGHQIHQSSWWVKPGLDPVLWEVSCASSFFPGKPQKRDSDHFDLTHPENHPESLTPPQTQTGLHHTYIGTSGCFANLRWVAMVRERPPWWVPSLLEVFQAWPPRWKRCTWSRRRRKNWSQMVWVERLLNPSCKKPYQMIV